MKILILGGYGTFGGKLAELLADEKQLTLLIAGRSAQKAEAFCRTLSAAAQLVPVALDRDGDFAKQLEALRPDIVVDATGPFQSYAGDQYRVVRACIALGIHYLDLADGSDFVKAIGQFDGEAKRRGIFILSGVSSFPVLTAAVARRLSQGLTGVSSIAGGIAPSPYAGVGPNVIRAVMSYAGKPIRLMRGGKERLAYALTESMRYTITPPGRLPLHNLRFSLVDVPDLQLLPGEYPGLDSIWIGVAPVPEILHRLLNGFAWLVKKSWIASLQPYATLIHSVINTVRWGEHRGGMFIALTGIDHAGYAVERSWHMLAEGSDGPLIPSMALEGVIRHVLAGNPPAPGARPATDALELEDYEALFSRHRIHTGFRGMDSMPSDAPLYHRVLGSAWQELPDAIREMHTLRGVKTASGRAQVERGTGRLSRMIAAFAGFPEAGNEVAVTVTFARRGKRETWRRNFSGKSFHSTQFDGQGRADGLLRERFGPFTFDLALVLQEQRLRLVVRGWRCLGIPLPTVLAPGGEAYEYVQDGHFHFHVEIAHPLTGLIVRYRGWLKPEHA